MLKPREIIWTKAAQLDLNSITAYISNDSPAAADHVLDTIEGAVQNLSKYPHLFKQSERMPGTRELNVFGSFLVFYRVLPASIEVVGVTQGRRKFPIDSWRNR